VREVVNNGNQTFGAISLIETMAMLKVV